MVSLISRLAFRWHWLGRWMYECRSKWPCIECRGLTRSWSCENCGEWYCLGHCDWDNESTWEYASPDYPICPHCEDD